jgi:hypothetical protein
MPGVGAGADRPHRAAAVAIMARGQSRDCQRQEELEAVLSHFPSGPGSVQGLLQLGYQGRFLLFHQLY